MIIPTNIRYDVLTWTHETLGHPGASRMLNTLDQGKNLVGTEMEELLNSYGIKHTYTTTYHPRCNSICERSHYTISEHLRVSGINNWHLKLPAIAWYMRSNHHSAIGTSPGALVYGRDMITEVC